MNYSFEKRHYCSRLRLERFLLQKTVIYAKQWPHLLHQHQRSSQVQRIRAHSEDNALRRKRCQIGLFMVMQTDMELTCEKKIQKDKTRYLEMPAR